MNDINDFVIEDGVLIEYNGIEQIVKIPQSVISIGERAFWGRTDLTSIESPSSVTSISSYAFYLCPSLTDVYYGGEKEDFDNIRIGTENDCLINATIHYPEKKKNSFRDLRARCPCIPAVLPFIILLI